MALTLHVCSFSYHTTGMPSDEFGHGGGFVFDCRCLPNPGRLHEYRELTGVDASVSKYLSEQAPVREFLTSVEALVNQAAAAHRQRSFEHLSIAFGCTGGQHRSVFCAEQLSQRFRSHGYAVTIEHHALPPGKFAHRNH